MNMTLGTVPAPMSEEGIYIGGAPQVPATPAPDPGKEFTSALDAYSQGAGQLYNTESQYQPMYNQLQRQMQQENIASYANQYTSMLPQMQTAADQIQNQASGAALGRQQQYGAQSYQAMLASNPALSQLSDFSKQQLNAGQDQFLSGLRDQVAGQTAQQVQGFNSLSAQVGRDVQPVNEQLQNLYAQTGQQTAQTAADLTGIRDKFAADPRSDIWKQTQGEVSGQLGKLDPLTQQLSDTAQQQLALGGSLSDAQKQDAVQAARGAYSSRGLLSSNGAIAAEVLGRQSYMQQMLQQREQFAAGVDPLVQQQIQQRTGNAMGFSQANEALTQANLGSAADITQNIAGVQNTGTQLQAGLQGQIMGNLQQARAQQSALYGQGVAGSAVRNPGVGRAATGHPGPATAKPADGRIRDAVFERDGSAESEPDSGGSSPRRSLRADGGQFECVWARGPEFVRE